MKQILFAVVMFSGIAWGQSGTGAINGDGTTSMPKYQPFKAIEGTITVSYPPDCYVTVKDVGKVMTTCSDIDSLRAELAALRKKVEELEKRLTKIEKPAMLYTTCSEELISK